MNIVYKIYLKVVKQTHTFTCVTKVTFETFGSCY